MKTQQFEKSKELFRKRFELNQELENLEFETQRLISRQNNGINMRIPDALSTVIGLANDLTNQTADLPESDSANQKFPVSLAQKFRQLNPETTGLKNYLKVT